MQRTVSALASADRRDDRCNLLQRATVAHSTHMRNVNLFTHMIICNCW